jgi:ATP-binding cassette subfamily B protein RaxB
LHFRLDTALYLQSEASECALASLAMVCSAHGLHQDLSELRRRFPISLKGATLQQLIAHAGALGFSSRPLRLDLAKNGGQRVRYEVLLSYIACQLPTLG